MKVYPLAFCTDYEGCSVHKVYSTKEKALAEKERLEKLAEAWQVEMEKTDYESDIPYPPGQSEDKKVWEFEVI